MASINGLTVKKIKYFDGREGTAAQGDRNSVRRSSRRTRKSMKKRSRRTGARMYLITNWNH